MGKFTRKKRVNAGELAKKLKDVKSQFYFFQKACIIPKKVTCSKCGHDMTSISYKLKQFKCPKCKSSRSWFKGTFMFGAKISMRKVIMLAYFFCMHPRMSQLNVIHEVGDSQDESSSSDDDTVPPSESPQGGEASNDTDNPVFTRKTLGNWYRFFSRVVINSLVGRRRIGGIGFTVELDERETKEFFLAICPENKRNKETLNKLILDNVAPGTKCLTDGWGGYNDLPNLGYTRDKVNHSKEFVRKDDRTIHTQRIECEWYQIKRKLPDAGRYDLDRALNVYLWRVTLLRSGVNPFWSLLSLLARPENNTRALFEPTAEELETKKKEKERRDRRAERRRVWLEEQAAKTQAHGASESTEVAAAETSRAARRRQRDERREAAQKAAESSSSSSSSEDESPTENMDTEDVIANDSCMFAACDIDPAQEPDQALASPVTEGAGSSAESEANPGPFICLFCGEEFPSEAAEDYHVMRECQNKE